MPKLALGEGERMTVLGWLIDQGTAFSEGQPLLEIETDKATMEIEAPFDGVLVKVLSEPGAEVEPGMAIAWLADPGEEYDAEEVGKPVSTRPEPPPDRTGADSPGRSAIEEPATEVAAAAGRDAGAPPMVSEGDLRGFPGEPPRRDVAAAAPAKRARPHLDPGTAGLFEAAPLSRHRAAVARTMLRSNTVPQLAVARDVDARAMDAALESLRERAPEATLSDVAVLAAVRALGEEPRLNGWLIDEVVYRFERVNIALAVDGPEGVIAPVIRSADARPEEELVRERSRIVAGARAGTLSGRDLLDATFTVSNIGPLGGDAMVPMLAPPQIAILALGRSRAVGRAELMTATLVGDHRALDGADAARFLTAYATQVASGAGLVSKPGGSASVAEAVGTGETEQTGAGG